MDSAIAEEEWLQEPHQDATRQISEVEYTRLSERFHTTGYREGIQRGKELSLQEGFDEGYSNGALRGKRVGLLRGRASAALSILLRQAEDDARTDRVRQLIRNLNHCGTQNRDSNDSNKANDLEDLTAQMDGLMTASNSNISHPQVAEEHKQQEEVHLLERCQFELDAILATMDIWLPRA